MIRYDCRFFEVEKEKPQENTQEHVLVMLDPLGPVGPNTQLNQQI